MRYRWVVLGAGVVAQAASAAVLQGLPGLAPQLREEYGLGLTGLGVLLASVTVGLLSTLVLWGVLADRYGERVVMTVGLSIAVLALLATTRTTTVVPLMACLVVAGAAGSSVNAASGRAVLGWFGAQERGFAMGVRQTALPLGAGIAAAGLPPVALAGGLDAAFVVLAGGCLLGALVVVALVREAPSQPVRVPGGLAPIRDPRIRRLGLVSLLLVVPQFAVVAFLVVYLVDEHDVSPARAALLLAAVQLGGGAGRIVAGRWSDRLGLRIVPLRRLALGITSLFVLLAGLEALDLRAAVPLLLLSGVIAISWNGLAFTAVGELAGPGRAGTALGLQNTAVALGAALTAPLLGAVVDRSDWAVGFALASMCALVAFLLLRRVAEPVH
ncbi:MAG: major facilitator transporter [Frankiales bacterium]|nr:major facilitator transporter [Frankiales bacterium]